MWPNQNLRLKFNTYPSAKKLAKDIPDHINIIGIGTGRLVIENPLNTNEIIKLAAGQGIEQNKNEINIWNISEKRNISHLLLPIKNYTKDKKCIIMPKTSTSFGLDKFHGPNSKQTYEELKKSGIIMRELETCIYEGNPVAYDYGGLKNIIYE